MTSSKFRHYRPKLTPPKVCGSKKTPPAPPPPPVIACGYPQTLNWIIELDKAIANTLEDQVYIETAQWGNGGTWWGAFFTTKGGVNCRLLLLCSPPGPMQFLVLNTHTNPFDLRAWQTMVPIPEGDPTRAFIASLPQVFGLPQGDRPPRVTSSA